MEAWTSRWGSAPHPFASSVARLPRVPFSVFRSPFFFSLERLAEGVGLVGVRGVLGIAGGPEAGGDEDAAIGPAFVGGDLAELQDGGRGGVGVGVGQGDDEGGLLGELEVVAAGVEAVDGGDELGGEAEVVDGAGEDDGVGLGDGAADGRGGCR